MKWIKQYMDLVKIGTTLFIFVAGFFLNWFFAKVKENREKKKKQRYLNQSILSYSKAIKNQVKALYPLRNNFEQGKFESIKLSNNVLFDVKNIEVISRIDAFDILTKKMKKQELIDAFSELYANIDLAQSIKEHFEGVFFKSYSSLNDIYTKWYESIDRIRQFYDKTIFEKPKNSDFFKELAELYQKWLNEDNREIVFTFKTFIKPLSDICKKHKNHEILNYCVYCEQQHNEYIDKFKINFDTLKIIINSFESCSIKIDENIDKLLI